MRLLLLFLCMACWVAAQNPRDRGNEPPNPLAGKPEAVEAGKKLFAGACSACHGKDGEGGGRGPNLADGQRIRRQSDQRVFASIQKGVPGADMPPFPLPDESLWQLVAYVRSLSAPAIESKIAGDPQAGGALFFGKAGCSSCHMVQGRGGFLGPDLSDAGMSRSGRQLREAVLEPNARLTEGFQGVTVTTRAGAKISGVAKNNTNYSIQILDAQGELHLLQKKDLREVVFHKNSLMPGDYGRRLAPEEIENVLAFLSRQSLRPPSALAKRRDNPRRNF